MANGSKYGRVFLNETIQFQTNTQYALNKSNRIYNSKEITLDEEETVRIEHIERQFRETDLHMSWARLLLLYRLRLVLWRSRARARRFVWSRSRNNGREA